MGIEYYTWMALSSGDDNWTDSDFEEAFGQVHSIIETFQENEGHEAFFNDSFQFPKTIYIKGFDVNDLTPLYSLVKTIGNLFDKSYGEIQIFDDEGDQHQYWDFNKIMRLQIFNGKIQSKLS